MRKPDILQHKRSQEQATARKRVLLKISANVEIVELGGLHPIHMNLVTPMGGRGKKTYDLPKSSASLKTSFHLRKISIRGDFQRILEVVFQTDWSGGGPLLFCTIGYK